jgi:dimeric dUTPase (all-alpha-NTP-PPase superfamily)
MNEDTFNKIKKLLRVATSSNQHEAELAMAHAQKLGILHNIDISSINAFDEKKEEEKYTKDDVNCGQRYGITQRFANWILEKHFNVKIILSGSRHFGKSIHIIGKTSDVEFAKYLNDYLQETFMRIWHSERKIKNYAVRERESFLYGLYLGLNQKLDENKKEVEEQKFIQISNEKGEEEGEKVKHSYSLMIVNDKEKLQAKVGDYFPHLRKGGSYRVRTRNYDVVNDGMAKGRTIRTNMAIA